MMDPITQIAAMNGWMREQREKQPPRPGPTMEAWRARIPMDIEGEWPDSPQAMTQDELTQVAMDSANPLGVVGRTASVVGKTTKNVIDGWKWRDLSAIRDELGLRELPEHVKQFGDFMRRQAERATRGELGRRDMAKANIITQASIQRSATDADKLRRAGLALPAELVGKVRPEGAMSEWLLSPSGQRYLDGIEAGRVDLDAVDEAVEGMRPFGKHNDLREKMILNNEVAPLGARMNDVVTSSYLGNRSGARSQMRGVVDGVKGVGFSKRGFLGSLLGYGIDPTLDARQIILHTGAPTKEAAKWLGKSSGRGADAAVARLASRQRNLGVDVPDALKPFDQHLIHHAVWDKAGNEVTTHGDVIKAMMLAGFAGAMVPKAWEKTQPAAPKERRGIQPL